MLRKLVTRKRNLCTTKTETDCVTRITKQCHKNIHTLAESSRISLDCFVEKDWLWEKYNI